MDSKFYRNIEKNLPADIIEGPDPFIDDLLGYDESESAQLGELSRIREKSFQFDNFEERIIKRGKKTRKIKMVNRKDKVLDRLVFDYLDENIYSSPHSKSIYNITISINKFFKNSKIFVLRADIKNFFDSVNLTIIKEILKDENDEILSSLIEAFLVKGKYKSQGQTELGIPQGCAISQALSNIYLKNLDELLAEYARDKRDLYFRYTDDICYLSTNQYVSTKLKTFF